MRDRPTWSITRRVGRSEDRPVTTMFGYIGSHNRKDSPMTTWLKLSPAILFLLIGAVFGVMCAVDLVGGWPLSTMRVLLTIGALAMGVMFLSQWIAMRRSARRTDRP
jgi:fructose-specific phosphotransferase system IIC component